MNENIDFKSSFADWQSGSSLNTQWQYSYVNRSAFYANISGEYQQYMRRWVQNSLWWYDGWVPYFHDPNQGIFSTRLATALVNGVAKKVVGGHMFFKNVKDEKENLGEGYKINKALSFIDTKWSQKSGFDREVKKAITFSAAAGTSLLKLDKAGGDLIAKALRFDSFYPTVGHNGRLVDLVCFIKDFTQLMPGKSQPFMNYYVVEHRYFGEYERLDGTIEKNVPLVSYEIKRSGGSMTSGQNYNIGGENIKFASLPKPIKSEIGQAFSSIAFDKPIRLPFHDHLGAELVNWTDCVSAIPELPFGESLLTNIISYLQSYDYYFSAFNTDMYIGRGRVLLPKYMGKALGKDREYNTGLDSMLFTKIQSTNPDNETPTPIQFDLRSQSWTEIRTMILQNIALGLNVNLATLASFLQDTNAARTAREISTEESETALFVDDKREILERPINRILKLVTLHYGYNDDVAIRWSAAGTTNIYARTEMLSTAVNAGFCSKKKAIQMWNQDSDEYQLKEEYDAIVCDGSFGGDYDGEQIAGYAGYGVGGNGDGNTLVDQTAVLQSDTASHSATQSQ